MQCWRTTSDGQESDKFAAKLVKRSSRIRGKRQREKKWFDFFHPIFRFLEDELAWIGQSSNFSLRLLLKLGKVRAQRTELLATSRFLSAELFATTELIRSKLPLPMFAPYCGRDKLSPNFLETNQKGKRNEQFSNLLPNTRSKLLISRLITVDNFVYSHRYGIIVRLDRIKNVLEERRRGIYKYEIPWNSQREAWCNDACCSPSPALRASSRATFSTFFSSERVHSASNGSCYFGLFLDRAASFSLFSKLPDVSFLFFFFLSSNLSRYPAKVFLSKTKLFATFSGRTS